MKTTLHLIIRESVLSENGICTTAILGDDVSFGYHRQGGICKTTEWVTFPAYTHEISGTGFLLKLAEEAGDLCWSIDIPTEACSDRFRFRYMDAVLNAAYVAQKLGRDETWFREKISNDLAWSKCNSS